MKILVCICQVPDTTTKISFTNNNTEFNTANVQYILNPTDEWYALVKACEIKETLGGTVTVITVGDASNEQNIRKALAIGADDAVRINTNPTDAYCTAAEIAHYAKNQNYNLIFTGKETIDYNGSSIGGMLAELLDLPYISLATSLSLQNNQATLTREVDSGIEKLTLDTPFVVSAQKGMAEQRIPNMRGIMSARSKPITVLEPANIAPLSTIISYELPPQRLSVKLIQPDNMAELVKLLHEEAKVI